MNKSYSPSKCHPVIAAIPNWQKKIRWPHPEAARLRRNLLKRGIPPFGYADTNMATPFATTYGLPIYNPQTRFHMDNPDRNEFWDKPELLRYVCHDGKVKKNLAMPVQRGS